MYCIREGYRHRLDNVQVLTRRRSDKYQREVYAAAAEEDPERVLDIGCGSGNKLLRHFADVETVGLEVQENLPYLLNAYPERDWRLSDFSSPPSGRFDVVICADVIEHIPNPDALMDFIYEIDFGVLFLSTPERRLLYGHDHDGPPRNEGHCREWTQDEFAEYVWRWFDIDEMRITNQEQATQMVIVRC